jgi:hypothetical protein
MLCESRKYDWYKHCLNTENLKKMLSITRDLYYEIIIFYHFTAIIYIYVGPTRRNDLAAHAEVYRQEAESPVLNPNFHNE